MRQLFFAAVLLVLSACSRINGDNYNKIQNGMTREEVYAILGKPDKVGGGALGSLEMSTETWNSGGQTITVTFGNGKLVIKAMGETEKPPEQK